MDGISAFVRPPHITVNEQANPWNALLPTLLQTIAGGAANAYIKSKLEQGPLFEQQKQLLESKQASDKELADKRMEAELIGRGFTRDEQGTLVAPKISVNKGPGGETIWQLGTSHGGVQAPKVAPQIFDIPNSDGSPSGRKMVVTPEGVPHSMDLTPQTDPQGRPIINYQPIGDSGHVFWQGGGKHGTVKTESTKDKPFKGTKVYAPDLSPKTGWSEFDPDKNEYINDAAPPPMSLADQIMSGLGKSAAGGQPQVPAGNAASAAPKSSGINGQIRPLNAVPSNSQIVGYQAGTLKPVYQLPDGRRVVQGD